MSSYVLFTVHGDPAVLPAMLEYLGCDSVSDSVREEAYDQLAYAYASELHPSWEAVHVLLERGAMRSFRNLNTVMNPMYPFMDWRIKSQVAYYMFCVQPLQPTEPYDRLFLLEDLAHTAARHALCGEQPFQPVVDRIKTLLLQGPNPTSSELDPNNILCNKDHYGWVDGCIPKYWVETMLWHARSLHEDSEAVLRPDIAARMVAILRHGLRVRDTHHEMMRQAFTACAGLLRAGDLLWLDREHPGLCNTDMQRRAALVRRMAWRMYEAHVRHRYHPTGTAVRAMVQDCKEEW
jgi:hypothetical protein